MPTPALDIETLRRAGLLPQWEEEWPGQPGSPAAMRNVNVAPAAPVQPQPTTQPFPWTVEAPSPQPFEPPVRQTFMDPKVASMTEFGGGRARIDAPYTAAGGGGTAEFTRETPQGLAKWLAGKQQERQAQEAAAETRATRTAQQQVAAEQQQQVQRQQTQGALRGVLQTQGPAAYLAAIQKMQQPATGSAEAQAFNQILTTQGLQPALAWLQQQNTTGQRGPSTPEQAFARVRAETAARFPGGRGAVAFDVSHQRALGAQQPDVPLTPEQAQKYGVPYGTTRSALLNQGLTDPTQRMKLGELSASAYLIDNLEAYAKRLITATSPVEAFAQRGTLGLGAFTKMNPDAATYSDDREAFLGILSRQIGAERGVLTDRDISRMDRALPSFGDTTAVRDRKLAFLKGLLNATQAGRTRALTAWLGPSGMPSGGMEWDQMSVTDAFSVPQTVRPTQPAPTGGRPGRYRDKATGEMHQWDGTKWLN